MRLITLIAVWMTAVTGALNLGNINILAVTDVHSWIAGGNLTLSPASQRSLSNILNPAPLHNLVCPTRQLTDLLGQTNA